MLFIAPRDGFSAGIKALVAIAPRHIAIEIVIMAFPLFARRAVFGQIRCQARDVIVQLLLNQPDLLKLFLGRKCAFRQLDLFPIGPKHAFDRNLFAAKEMLRDADMDLFFLSRDCRGRKKEQPGQCKAQAHYASLPLASISIVGRTGPTSYPAASAEAAMLSGASPIFARAMAHSKVERVPERQ